MPKPYDVITKRLIDTCPDDWLRLLGLPGSDAEPIEADILDSDLATVTLQADRVLKVRLPEESLFHIEMETGRHGAQTPGALLRYSVLLTGKYGLGVQSAVVLLRPEADSPALTGLLEYRRPGGDTYLTFGYTVVRVWEIPVEILLAGGIGTLPLAPISAANRDSLPEIVQEMKARLDSEPDPVASELWTATRILMGLRYPAAVTDRLLRGVREMRESVTYQAILEEGEAIGEVRGERRGELKGERDMLLQMGARRLGEPSEAIRAKLAAITSPAELMVLGNRIFDVETWDDLLAESP